MTSRVERLLRQGHRYAQRRQTDLAIASFEKVVEVAPDDRRGYIQVALALARRGDYDGARAMALAAISRLADDPVVCLLTGRCLLECDDPTTAEPVLRTAAQMQPDNILAQQYLALCELMNGEIARAAERFELVGFAANSDFLALLSHEIERRIAPKPVLEDRELLPPSESLARLIARLEERADAAARARLAGKIVRGRIVGKLMRLGNCAYERGNLPAALAAFEAAARCAHDESTGLLEAGIVALRLGRPNHAAQLLSRAFSHRPDDGILLSVYGDTLWELGKAGEALAIYGRIEPAGPDDFHANYRRGACLVALGRKVDALEQFRVAFDRYRLDSVDDCLLPSWEKLVASEKECGKPSTPQQE